MDFAIKDIIALYAAVLSTVLGVWEFVKWLDRNAISLKYMLNMVDVDRYNVKEEVCIHLIVANKGNAATTIINFFYIIGIIKLIKFCTETKLVSS